MSGLFGFLNKRDKAKTGSHPDRGKSSPPPPLTPYAAVELVAKAESCQAAKALHGQRFLVTEAPRLPLALCSRAGQCRCELKPYTDRRCGEDRRLLAARMRQAGLDFIGEEQRGFSDRRRR